MSSRIFRKLRTTLECIKKGDMKDFRFTCDDDDDPELLLVKLRSFKTLRFCVFFIQILNF